MAMYDFEAEYRGLFEKPLEEIQQDIFFRADNFQNEKWYGELQIYLAIGICQTDRDCASDLQKGRHFKVIHRHKGNGASLPISYNSVNLNNNLSFLSAKSISFPIKRLFCSVKCDSQFLCPDAFLITKTSHT